MSFLKKLGDKNQTSIVQMLHERLAGMRKARPLKHVHASDLTHDSREFCPREYALTDLTHKKRPDEFISTALQTTFDNGSEIQARLNNDWLTDVMVGDWQCGSCGDTAKLCKKPKMSCGKSGIRCNWQYEEHRIVSPVSGISCGIDAMIDINKTRLKMVEVKTMAQDAFKTLAAPKAEHRIRTRLYMRCAREAGLSDIINTDSAKVLYISRGYGVKATPLPLPIGRMDAPFSPFKEFDVKANDESLDDLVELATQVKTFRETGLMPSGVCKNYACERAKGCPVVKECFSGKYKAGGTYGAEDN